MTPPETSGMRDGTRDARTRSAITFGSRPNGGGGRGIRTPGTLPGTVVFKTTAIDHSAIPPAFASVQHQLASMGMPVFASVQRTQACFGGQARLRATTPPTCRKESPSRSRNAVVGGGASIIPARNRAHPRTHFVALSVLFEDHSPHPDDWWPCPLRIDKAGCCGTRTAAWLVSRLRHADFSERQSGSIGTPPGLPHRCADSRGKSCGRPVHLQADHTVARAGHERNAFEGLRDILCPERFG